MAAVPVIARTTHSFGAVPLATTFRLIRALDIGYVDLVAQPPGRQLDAYAMAADPQGEARRLADMAASAGITLSGCFVTGFREQLADHGSEQRRRLPDLYGAIARCARGCGIVHVQASSGQAHPALPAEEQFAIGAVGCGNIMRGTHLPAYKTFGYRVVAACDVVEENARRAAEHFGIPRATSRLDDLLDDPEIAVIDLAVHASQRRPIIERIAAAGKHVLSQKPFALTYADARHMVETCERAGVTLMVNQQARWAPAHRALRLRPPVWLPGPPASPSAVVRRDRLGGLLHEYESAAA
jgi:hypothetical protein